MTTSYQRTAVDFLKALAFLRREFLGRSIADVSDGPGGTPERRRTIYFYDTDVIRTYCAPWDRAWGPTVKERLEKTEGSSILSEIIGIGEVIPEAFPREDGEGEDRAIHIAAILSEHVLSGMREAFLPIYQFPAHFADSKRVFEKLQMLEQVVGGKSQISARSADQRLRFSAALLAAFPPIEKGTELLPIVAEMLARMETNNTPFPKWKTDQVRSTPEQIDREWERFNRLNALTGGVFPSEMIPRQLQKLNDSGLSQGVAILDRPLTEDEAEAFAKIRSMILKEIMSRPGLSETEATSYGAGADAIAWIYFINRELRNTNWRAVFVTCSRVVVDASYTDFRSLGGLDSEIANSFSQKYIRHISAYTTEALLEPDSEGRKGFINWMDGLFAIGAEPDGFKEYKLTSIVRRPKVAAAELLKNEAKSADEFVADVSERWKDLTEKAVSKHRIEALGISTTEALRLQRRILEIAGRNRDPSERFQHWEDLIADLKEEYHLSKDRTFIEYSKMGTESVFFSESEHRNPPDLSFGSLHHTNRIFSRLCDPKPYSRKEFDSDFEGIQQDCPASPLGGDDRLLSHLKYLVLGAAFAASNRWAVALSQGKRAVSTARRLPRKEIPTIRDEKGGRRSYLSGREAYFLCAVSTRMIAKNDRDLDAALKLLDESQEKLSLDQSLGTAKKLTIVRYECERLEIALARYYQCRKSRYEESGSKHSNIDQPYESQRAVAYCDEFIPAITLATDRLLSFIRNRNVDHRPFEDSSANLSWLGRVTLVHVATSLIQVATIQAYRRSRDRVDIERPVGLKHLEQALKIIQYFRDPPPGSKKDGLRQTPLIALYEDAGARLFGAFDDFPWARNVDELDGIFKRTEARDVTEHDSWRFDRLREFAEAMNLETSKARRSLVSD